MKWKLPTIVVGCKRQRQQHHKRPVIKEAFLDVVLLLFSDVLLVNKTTSIQCLQIIPSFKI